MGSLSPKHIACCSFVSSLGAHLWQWREQSGWLTPAAGSERYTSRCPRPRPSARPSASGCRSQTPLDDDYRAAACRPSATWWSSTGSQSRGTLCRCSCPPLRWCPAWVWFGVDLETQGREGGDGGRRQRERERERHTEVGERGRWGEGGHGRVREQPRRQEVKR